MKSWFVRRRSDSSPPPQVRSRAADVSPSTRDAELLIQQGQALEDAGSAEQAVQCYEKAIARAPQLSSAWLNLGNAQQALGQITQAIASFREAIGLDAHYAAAWLNLGNALLLVPAYTQEARHQTVSEAEMAYRAALAARPNWAEAWFGLGCALEQRRLLDEAEAAYSSAVNIEPLHEAARFNLSDLRAERLSQAKKVTEARQVIIQALERVPGHRRLLARLADLERDCGNLAACLEALGRLIEQEPTDFERHSVWLFNQNYRPDFTAADLCKAAQRFGRLLEQAAAPVTLPSREATQKRIRVGYVSPDFRGHPVAVFMIPVLRLHDREKFEIFCYHCYAGQDAVTETVRGLSEHWRDVAKLSDDIVAQRIVDDRIDILIDLAGHTGDGRLPVFARKPARVQITWLGYMGTTGLSRMDYRICDAVTDPPGAERWHAEQLLRMPDTQWCYEPQVSFPVPPALPYFRNGYWTFGSFNNPFKLNEQVFSAWSKLMVSLPRSRLKVFSIDNDEIRRWVGVSLGKFGITADRVDLIGRRSMEDYLASADLVDIALDPFPYTGCTTTCDTLSMGLPVASVEGGHSLSRSTQSLLQTIGLEAWVAPSMQTFAATIKTQLADPQKIAALRADLPGRMRASALMDAPRFTRNLEQQFETAWQRWAQSQVHLGAPNRPATASQ